MSSKKDPLEYRSKSFSATVSVRRGERDFEAVFHLSPPDPEGHISFRIDFLSPSSLEGLSVVQSKENFKILLDGKEYISENSPLLSGLGIARAVSALSPTEPIRSIKSENGFTLVNAGNYVIYIDPSTSLPVKSVSEAEDLTVTVHSFSFD